MDTKTPKSTVIRAAGSSQVHFAREQRRKPTEGEELLWIRIRRGRLGVHFRRQHPYGDFILDFYAPGPRIAIEVDGPVHEEQRNYDAWRDETLRKAGIRTLRIADAVVKERMDDALRMIREALKGSLP